MGQPAREIRENLLRAMDDRRGKGQKGERREERNENKKKWRGKMRSDGKRVP